MRDVCDMYGIEINRAGFAICPFHTEKTPSMRVFADGVKCFGCGFYASNCIDLVIALFDLSFHDACAKINNDFRLGLTLDLTPSLKEVRAAEAALAELKKRKQAEKAEREAKENAYQSALDEWCRLDRQRLNNMPDGMINDLYADAVKKLPYAAYLLDIAGTELYEYEHKRDHNH